MTKADQLVAVTRALEEQAGSLPLTTTAADIVPGEGTPEAEVMLIGEAPGYNETVQRRPFVGLSGKLLRQTLTDNAIPPESVFISNIVKARPPENRDPTPEEIAAYRPFLDREIEILNPYLVITLGRYSMAKFLPSVKISQIHGRLQKVSWNKQTLYVLPMYHPAAALRAPQVKISFIADFKKVLPTVKWVKEQKELNKLTASVTEALF